LKIGAEASFNKTGAKNPAAETAEPGAKTPGQTQTAPK
jgi:hypothetical protein